MARGIGVVGCEETRVGCSWGIFMENRFVCNVTVFQVDLTEVEEAGLDRTGPGSLLPAWPGAFYLREQGACYLRVQGAMGSSVCVDREPSICVAKELSTCVVKESFTCVATEPSTQGKLVLIRRCGSHTAKFNFG